MKSIAVHCSPEFIPGQTYVAISRVRREDDGNVIGFRKHFLLPPPPSLTELITTSSGDPLPTFRCCKKMELDKACFVAESEENESCINDEDGVCGSTKDDCLQYDAAAKS